MYVYTGARVRAADSFDLPRARKLAKNRDFVRAGKEGYWIVAEAIVKRRMG